MGTFPWEPRKSEKASFPFSPFPLFFSRHAPSVLPGRRRWLGLVPRWGLDQREKPWHFLSICFVSACYLWDFSAVLLQWCIPFLRVEFYLVWDPARRLLLLIIIVGFVAHTGRHGMRCASQPPLLRNSWRRSSRLRCGARCTCCGAARPLMFFKQVGSTTSSWY